MNNSIRAWICAGTLLLICPLASAANGRFSDQEVQRGAYLARAGDCIACHTESGGKPYAGGFPIHMPMHMGTVYGPNITPDRQYGIGNYSYQDFDRAVRRGVTPAGKQLYPAMPYPSFARISQSDMHALYAYFMQGVKPVSQPNRKDAVDWPMSMRWTLGIWKHLFVDQKVFRPDPQHDPQWNRGAYLVEGLGHCGACHTPRGWFFQEKAMGPNSLAYLSGAAVDNWFADDLRGDQQGGLGRWSKDDIVDLLQDGRTVKYAAAGSMTDVIHHSTQYLDKADLEAIAVFLKSLPPAFADNQQAVPPPAPSVAKQGKALYGQYCAMCHRANGEGLPNLFPALALNTTVESRNPLNTIRMMLDGGHTAKTKAIPTVLPMPMLGGQLNNEQIAAIASYIRSSWGNHASAVSVATVKKVRAAVGKTSRTAAGS